MAVKSEPMLIKREALKNQRKWVTFYIAWSMLILGWLGTFVATNGGWYNVLSARITWSGTIVAVVSQAVLTWIQWAYSDHTFFAYVSRAIDAALTAAGYGPLVYSTIAMYLFANVYSDNYTYVGYVTWFILWGISLVPAWYPEHRLIEE